MLYHLFIKNACPRNPRCLVRITFNRSISATISLLTFWLLLHSSSQYFRVGGWLMQSHMWKWGPYTACLYVYVSDLWYGLDWIEQGLTSPPTQYRLCGRQFNRSKDLTNSIKVLKEKLASHRPEEAPVQKHQGPPTVLQVNLWKKEKPYHSGSSHTKATRNIYH